MTGRRGKADDGFARRRFAAAEADLDLTPMIDVTFLLLIFFMVTSTMRTPDPTDVPPAATATTAERGSAYLVRLERLGDVTKLTFEAGGEERTLEAEKAIANGMFEAAVRDAVDARDGAREVLLNAAGETRHGLVAKVARVVESVPGTRLFFGVREVAEGSSAADAADGGMP